MAYDVISRDPSSQFVFGFERQMDTITTDITNRIISKWGKFKVIFFPLTHPARTITGMTKREIWVQEPMAT